MQQSGEYRIGAAREAVWRALNDLDVLSRSIDGCQSMTQIGGEAFRATVKAKIGPVSALFTADVELTELDPPRSYTLKANAKGGAVGFGRGTAKVALVEEGGATLLRYEVEGAVGGKLAQVGQRLIDASARKMADDFFYKFGEIVAPGASAKTAPSRRLAPPKSGRHRMWVVAMVVAVLAIIVAILLTR
jgi:carbon monoxide dehydrogenase subunit G